MELNIPPHAARALETLEARGYESYVVGGCVRDSLRGVAPHDWDICTAAPPGEVAACFAGERVLETGLKHGTLTLLTEEGPLEITTFRTEGAYSDGRRPDTVTFVDDVHEDLRRRDFTVNAMAYSPRRGLRDDFGGRADLAAGLLRCVGDPGERFREDGLRLLRALRFAARFGFTVEAETAAALRRDRALLLRVSPERIFAELTGILCAPGAGEMLRNFPEVFFVFLPELAPMLGFDQHRPDCHHLDVWGHTAAAVDAAPPERVLRLTMLFHDSGKPACFSLDPETLRGRFYGHPAESVRIADAALRRLRCDNATREAVTALTEYHQQPSGLSGKAFRRLAGRLGWENMERLMAVRRADALAHAPQFRERLLAQAEEDEALLRALRAENAALRLEDLAIRGRDLLALGLDPGPRVGAVLAALLEQVLEGEVENERTALLRRAEELIIPTKEASI